MVEAIKEAVLAHRHVLDHAALADDTLGRMASASAASEETAETVKVTVAATEELSASIHEIGEQATRGLEMARSGGRYRTQPTTPSARSTRPPNASAPWSA